jgi:2-C-methyl-D-erythritol 4-phosphate cytidylyltransferase
MTVAAVLVAAGSGSRLGADVPKAFVRVGGRTLLELAAERFRDDPRIGECIVVAPDNWVDEASVASGCRAVPGGATRQLSVDAGLRALSEQVETVLVHDVARPFAPVSVVDRVLAALADGADAVVPGMPLADTIKQVDDNQVVVGTVDRSTLVAVQTPQGFRLAALVAAHEAAPDEHATDDAALVEAMGGRVVVVAGDSDAFKITTPDDLLLAEAVAGRE